MELLATVDFDLEMANRGAPRTVILVAGSDMIVRRNTKEIRY
jgi:hypothetical protein